MKDKPAQPCAKIPYKKENTLKLATRISAVTVKVADQSTGEITGYASTFGNIDSYGESMKNGAFSTTLKEHSDSNTSIPLLFEHNRGLDSHIGVITSAKEDATGLLITAKLDTATESGKKAFNLVKSRRVNGMSIGFMPLDVEPGVIDGKDVTLIKQVELKEISLVLNPADSHAQVTSVKSAAEQNALISRASKLEPIAGTSSLVERGNTLVEEIKSLVDHYGSNLPDQVSSSIQAKFQEFDAIESKIAKGEEKAANLRQLTNLSFDDDVDFSNSKKTTAKDMNMNQRLALKSDERLNVAHTLATSLHLKEGEATPPRNTGMAGTLLPVEVNTDILNAERAPRNLLAAIPVEVTPTPSFSYLRQTARELNADVVPTGEVKPKSNLGFDRVDSSLEVIAHIVRGVDEYILKDLSSLKSFISRELITGVYERVEQLIYEEISTVEDAQLQEFNTDSFTTARLAKAKLQSLGLEPAFYTINYDDWALMETVKAEGSGNFLFNSAPVNTTDGTLWGIPVLPTIHAEAGKAKLVSKDSVGLFTDGDVRLAMNASMEEFETNEVSFRAEGRFKAVVYRSLGIVDVPLVEPVAGE